MTRKMVTVFGAIYEFERFWQTNTTHRMMARQKAFIRRMIEMTGMDYTIIPAGAWIEYYMMEPVLVMGDADTKIGWSTGADVGRKVERVHWSAEQWRAAYAQQAPGAIRTLLAIGVAITDTPAGMSLFGNWNKTFIPGFQGTPLDELFVGTVEPFVAAMRAGLIAAGELPASS